MNEIKILNLIGIIALSGYIYFSYKIIQEDFQHYRISNKLQIQMLKAFIFLFAVCSSILISYSLGSFWVFIKLFLVHIMLSSIAGFILWHSDYWPAGDAKYYILSMFFLPLIFLPHSSKYYPLHLWLSSMANSFALSVLYMLIKFAGNWLYIDKSKIIFRENPFKIEPNNWIHYFKKIIINIGKILIFFIFGKFINIFFKNLIASLFERPEFIYFFIFFFWEDLEENVFNKKIYHIISIIFYILYFGIMLYISPKLLMTQLVLSLKYASILIMVISLLKKIFDKIIFFSSVEFLKIFEIKEGMSLSEREIEKIKQITPDLYEEFVEYNILKGLTTRQIEALNKFVFRLHLEKMEFEVYKIKSFAVWIFTGCIFQIVFDINLLYILKF